MQYIYFGTVFAALVILFFAAVLLLLQRKNSEWSRIFLASTMLILVGSYFCRIINFKTTSTSFEVMPVSLLLVGILVISTYILYPIEVISPGWLDCKRVIKIYVPFICLSMTYWMTSWLGMDYTQFHSTIDLFNNIGSFEVLFRIVLSIYILRPTILLCYMIYTRRYNNVDYKWIRIYITAVTLNVIIFLLVVSSDSIIVRTLFYAVSVYFCLCVVYQELFIRLIRQSLSDQSATSGELRECSIDYNMIMNSKPKDDTLFDRLEHYMNSTQAWRNPDLSVSELTKELYTNRTTLREAILQNGFTSYTHYVNGKRIEEFIKTIWKQGGYNYQQAFFDVGFRHKTTALRNFREVTGMTPSVYFQKQVNK